jgi:hypothetical protein
LYRCGKASTLFREVAQALIERGVRPTGRVRPHGHREDAYADPERFRELLTNKVDVREIDFIDALGINPGLIDTLRRVEDPGFGELAVIATSGEGLWIGERTEDDTADEWLRAIANAVVPDYASVAIETSVGTRAELAAGQADDAFTRFFVRAGFLSEHAQANLLATFRGARIDELERGTFISAMSAETASATAARLLADADCR